MGSRGLLSVDNRVGRVSVAARDQTQVFDDNTSPLTPEEVKLQAVSANLQPTGTTEDERQDIADAGVPKVDPINGGGSGFLSTTLVQSTQASTPPPPPPTATTRVIVQIPALP
jgi:hypothetical protein